MTAESATLRVRTPHSRDLAEGMGFAATMYNVHGATRTMAQETRTAPEVEVRKRLFTVDEFHRMGEAGILGEDDRLELLDGEIVEMTPIGTRHAACVRRFNHLFSRRAGAVAIVDVQNPVILSERTELYPDLVLLKQRADFYGESHPRPADVLLVVEVADTTRRYDRRVKVPRYARAGVPEVWVVDLQEGAIDIYRQPGPEGYAEHLRVGPGESLSIPGATDQRIAVEEVLG